MISTFRRIFLSLVVFTAAVYQPASAMVCGPDAVDPDGDGWGWENGKSCTVESKIPQERATCEQPGSDPDGDGWGWENGKSCISVSAGNVVEITPGVDLETAPTIVLNTEIQATFEDVGVHYYKFEITELIAVTLQKSYRSDGSIVTSITDDSSYYISDANFGGISRQCIKPGVYYLEIDRYAVDTFPKADYSFSLRHVERNCAPAEEFDFDQQQTFLTEQGDVFAIVNRDGPVLVKYDLNWEQVWEFSLRDWVFSGDIQSNQDGYVFFIDNANNIVSLDSSGQLLWEIRDDPAGSRYYSQLLVGNNTILVEDGTHLVALNPADGKERWAYELVNGYFNIVLARGKVLIDLGHKIVVVDEGI